jgi:hypothetical protein
MSAIEPGRIEGVLDQVKGWPSTERLRLARMILESIEHAPAVEEPPRRIPLEQVFGLLKTDAPPPTDEECARIIEEERMRKYG